MFIVVHSTEQLALRVFLPLSIKEEEEFLHSDLHKASNGDLIQGETKLTRRLSYKTRLFLFVLNFPTH